MDTVKIIPEKTLQSYWITMCIIIFFILTVPSLIPFVAEVFFYADLPGVILSAAFILAYIMIVVPLLFWIPAYFRSLEYVLNEDSVKATSGVFWKRNVTVPFGKVTNIDITQGPLQRRFGIGTIHVQTAGAGGNQGGRAELVIYGIKNLAGVKDMLSERITGHIGSKRNEGTTTPLTAGSETLEKILEELIAIRKTIEKD